MAGGTVHVVRRSIRLGVIVALTLALLFLGAARKAGAPAVAQYGGTAWVFILSTLIALPLLTPLIRKQAGR